MGHDPGGLEYIAQTAQPQWGLVGAGEKPSSLTVSIYM